MRHNEIEFCDTLALRKFLQHCTNGHLSPTGRWGNPLYTNPVRPRTIHTYHSNLRTFFNFLVEQGDIDESPLNPVAAPIHRKDQIQPFTDDELRKLYDAASKLSNPERDKAILDLLLDTGVRASELCSIKYSDIDKMHNKVYIRGKGNKFREIIYSEYTAKSLSSYLRYRDLDDSSYMFSAERGRANEEGLTRSGLRQLIERIAIKAGLTRSRCCPHTFRHTFAVSFLRSGGNQFTLQSILGHSHIEMTANYVKIAQADIAAQHKLHSPVKNLRRSNKYARP